MSGVPANPVEAAMRLAEARHSAGDLAGAEALYRGILAARPDHISALHNLGSLLASRGDEAGIALLQAGVAIAPQDAQLWYALGVACQLRGDVSAAVAAYRRTVTLDAARVVAWENLGVALQDLGESAAAEFALREALRLRPESPTAKLNLPKVLKALGAHEAALEAANAALESDPANPDLRLLAGTLNLTFGQWRDGWAGFEWRYLSHEESGKRPPRMIAAPRWQGEPLSGKRLYLYGEQGVGDEIMFARWAAGLADVATEALLECDPRLRVLFSRSFPKLTCIERPQAQTLAVSAGGAGIDWRLATPSLPAALRIDNPDSMDGRPYLRVDQEALARWRAFLGDKPGWKLNVAVSWRGGSDPRVMANRSIDLERWAPLIDAHPNVRFLSVQYGDDAAEIAAFNTGRAHGIETVPGLDATRDLDGLAAFMCACDLVIAVDNSTVHLAGAIGANTWVLLPGNADYRWLRLRDDTPWYSSVRLIRAAEGSDWVSAGADTVLSAASAALAALCRKSSVIPGSDTEPVRLLSVSAGATSDHRSRVLLLNDTTYWYHWGCTCTSLALREALSSGGAEVIGWPISQTVRLRPPASRGRLTGEDLERWLAAEQPALLELMRTVDRVVVNGEGTLHGDSAPALSLLCLALLARNALGKPVEIVNHSCFPPWDRGSDLALSVYEQTYRSVDRVVVREPLSLENVARLGVRATLGFDSLPLFVDAHPVQRDDATAIVVAGSVSWTPRLAAGLERMRSACEKRGLNAVVLLGANGWMAADDIGFAKFSMKFLGPVGRLVCARSEAHWLRTIASARLLVSGRFHHTIAAACVGTPFLVGETNTTKISGMLDILGVDAAAVTFGSEGPTSAVLSAALDGALPTVSESTGNHVRQLALANTRQS